MKLLGCTCILFYLFVFCRGWPRYGRPHPLYRGRQQTSNNVLASAVLLGLDFNELQTLQSAVGQELGLGNLGLPNNGFPMNAWERKRARQDVNTLTAIGVFDSPEEAGPFGTLMKSNAPDPPDNAPVVGKDGKTKGSKKAQAKRKGKEKATKKVQKISGNQIKEKKVLQTGHNVKRINNKTKVSDNLHKMKTKQSANSKTQSAKKPKLSGKGVGKNIKKKKTVAKIKMHRPRNRGVDGEGGENMQTGGKGRPAKQRNRTHGRQGRRNFAAGGDPGEGRLAEQGAGDFVDRPFGGRGGRKVVWRTGGEDGQLGGGDLFDRRFFVRG